MPRTLSVPQYSGISSYLPDETIGKTENKGIEAILGFNKRWTDFRINLEGNFTYATSKKIYIAEAEGVLDWQKETGKPIGADFLVYDAIGVFDSTSLADYPHMSGAVEGELIFRDVDEDGDIDADDRIRLDKGIIPEIIYGLNINLGYKQFELSMLWQGAGRVVQQVFFESGKIGNFTQDFVDNHWKPDRPSTTYPRVYDRQVTISGREMSTFWIKDASYLRLKNLQLAYSLPKNLSHKLRIENLQVYVSGFNLITLDKIKYIDPEGRAHGQGWAGWYTPQSKVYNIGLNLTF